jgi:MFS family permease
MSTSAHPDDRVHRVPRERRVGVLYGLVFADSASYTLVVPILSLAALQIGLSTVSTGLMFATYSLLQIIAAPLLGAASARIGRRTVLMLCQAGSALGFAVLVAHQTPTSLFLARAIDGATGANFALLLASVLHEDPPTVWNARFATIGASNGAGYLVGLLAGTALAEFGLGTLALVAASLQCACLLATSMWMRSSKAVSSARVAPRVASGKATGIGRALKRMLVVVLIGATGQSIFLLVLPRFVHDVLRWGGAETLGLLAALAAITAVIQIAVLPRMFARWSGERVVAVGFALMLLGGAGFAITAVVARISGPGSHHLALTAAVVGTGIVHAVGSGSFGPALVGLISMRRGAIDEGTLMGIRQSMVSLGQLLGPVIGYAALAAAGSEGFGLSCAIFAAGSLAALALAERTKPDSA